MSKGAVGPMEVTVELLRRAIEVADAQKMEVPVMILLDGKCHLIELVRYIFITLSLR